MIEINWADVEGVLQNVRPQLISFGVVAILAVVVMIACLKMAKPTKFLIRCEAGLAIFLALVITVNAICLGPMSSMIDLATGRGSISEGTSNNALTLAEDVAREGIVLLQNDDGLLPLAKDSNYVTDTTSATSLLAMRQAVKNVLFTVVNSRAYEAENLNPGMAAWRIILIVVDVVLAAAFIALELVVIRSWKRKSKAV